VTFSTRLSNSSTLKVLVIDDSAVVRQVVSGILSSVPGITVAIAADPIIAAEKIRRDRPDVILLDIQMPRMDGLTFLRQLMREDPLPVVVCSSLAETGTDTALQALEEGAVAIISKPSIGARKFLEDSAIRLIDAVQSAARARLRRRLATSNAAAVSLSSSAWNQQTLAAPVARRPITTEKIVVIGASTGGTEAIVEILKPLNENVAGIVVVQHMPELFTDAFARRLDQMCRLAVKEAQPGDRVSRGLALIAPGNRHVSLRRSGMSYCVDVHDGPLVNRHRPSVDVLFRSAAKAAGPNCMGIILTGMGNDGAAGMLELRRAGATTVAQDEDSCVVFGMPREAIELGAVQATVPLGRISDLVRNWSDGRVPHQSASAL